MDKVAVVGVVGRTNAGKSTLVNRLVGEKVSIVSPVEQTTRNTVRGIVSDPRGQLVLLDTPGLHKAVGTLGKLLNRMARRSAAHRDSRGRRRESSAVAPWLYWFSLLVGRNMPSYYCHCRAPRLTEVALRARKIGTYILLAAFFAFLQETPEKTPQFVSIRSSSVALWRIPQSF